MEFRTKLDYSDNRQIKQRERSETTLSGTTIFGMPFSGLTSGPDLATTAQTSQYFGVTSTYSGNSATTIFTNEEIIFGFNDGINCTTIIRSRRERKEETQKT